MEENNQEKKDNEFKTVTSTKDSTYRSFNPQKEGIKGGFVKTVAVPFLCGVVGAGVVVGGCIGVPTIRNTLLSKMIVSTVTQEQSNTVSLDDINTKLITLSGFSDTSISVAQKIKPSIVGISVEYSVNSIFNRGTTTAKAEGSGVIISSDGYILTNNHVVNSSSSSSSFYEIEEASKVTVKLYNDDKEYDAKIIGTDAQTDLAVIKIDKTDLTAAELGNSDAVQVGEFCMAVGNALGLGDSVTSGIISATNREVTDSDNNTYVAIQTDAAINSGNSGGALVNSKGEVIGINTLKVSGTGVEGVGFAIPINSTKEIAEQLIQYNKVKRPYIGISGTDIDEDLSRRYNLPLGIYVRSIEAFSAAEKAGIKIGDVIIEADGKKITKMDELNEIKNTKKIGDTIKLKISRANETKEFTVTLQEQP